LLETKLKHDNVLLPRDKVPWVKEKLAAIVKLAPSVKPTVALLSVTAEQTAPLAVVQVPVPEPESKITVSAATGAEAPDAPPVVADQLDVEDASQVPEPPTQ
jgi:hypothetical protein